MNRENLEKLKRLIAFRERQRDMAAAAMEEARRQQLQAETEQQKAEEALRQELQIFRDAIGHSFFPKDLELAVQTAKWAQADVNTRERIANEKQRKTEEERGRLLASHKKVKQMETLHNKRKQEMVREQALTEQAEMDDLASVREVHR